MGNDHHEQIDHKNKFSDIWYDKKCIINAVKKTQ